MGTIVHEAIGGDDMRLHAASSMTNGPRRSESTPPFSTRGSAYQRGSRASVARHVPEIVKARSLMNSSSPTWAPSRAAASTGTATSRSDRGAAPVSKIAWSATSGKVDAVDGLVSWVPSSATNAT